MSSRSPTRIFLVRHGAAAGADGVVVGRTDLPLSDHGGADLERLSASWNDPPPWRLVASDLARSRQSAERLGRGWDLAPEIDPRLREMDFGTWDGLAWSELQRREGARLDAWMERWWEIPPPEGESFVDVAARAREWLEETVEAAAGKTVLAVAHGGTIRAMLGHVLGMPLERAFHLHLDHGRVSALVTGRRGVEVGFINSERFPEPPGATAPGSPRG